jgi:hypothetical protein
MSSSAVQLTPLVAVASQAFVQAPSPKYSLALGSGRDLVCGESHVPVSKHLSTMW